MASDQPIGDQAVDPVELAAQVHEAQTAAAAAAKALGPVVEALRSEALVQLQHCPCCGWDPSRPSLRHVAHLAQLTPNMRKILAVLNRRFGQVISIGGLADLVYADDPDGGPDWPAASLHVTIKNMRDRLAPFGLTVGRIPGHGPGVALRWADADGAGAGGVGKGMPGRLHD